MQYKELKEMTLKEWDGKPFNAVCCGYDGCEICDSDKKRLDCPDKCALIVGYLNGEWRTKGGLSWTHVYPVEWNKEKIKEALNPKHKRMTNRQLAMWIAKGNGEVAMNEGCAVLHRFDYGNEEANEPILASIRVRKWDSEEWIEPTIDLLEGM